MTTMLALSNTSRPSLNRSPRPGLCSAQARMAGFGSVIQLMASPTRSLTKMVFGFTCFSAMNLRFILVVPIIAFHITAFSQVSTSKTGTTSPCENLVSSSGQKAKKYIELSMAEFESDGSFTPDIKNEIEKRFDGFLKKVAPFLDSLQTRFEVPVNLTKGRWGHYDEDCTVYRCISMDIQLWTPREIIFSSISNVPAGTIDSFWNYTFPGLAHELGHYYFQTKLKVDHSAFFEEHYLDKRKSGIEFETLNYDIKLWVACEELFADIFAGLIFSNLGVMADQFGPTSFLPNSVAARYRAFNPDDNRYFNDPIEFEDPYYLLGKVRSFIAREVLIDAKTSVGDRVKLANLIRDVLIEARLELNLDPKLSTEDAAKRIESFNAQLIKSLKKALTR